MICFLMPRYGGLGPDSDVADIAGEREFAVTVRRDEFDAVM